MTRYAALAAALVLMGGCGQSNEERIAEFQKCKEAGMRSEVGYFTWDISPVIFCAPPRENGVQP